MSKKSHKTNMLLLGAIFGVAIAIDIFLATSSEHYTFSQTIVNTLRAHPWLPFSLGVLMGHLFWPVVVKEKDGKEVD